MKKKVIVSLIVVAVILIGYFSFFRKKAPTFETVAVTRQDLIQTVSVTGELKSDEAVSLDFETTGRVKSVTAEIGDQVAAGEMLATIDDNVLTQKVTNAKAALDQALAQSGISNDEIDRLQGSVDNAKDFLSDTKDLEEQKLDAAKKCEDDAQRSYDDAIDYYEKVVAEKGASSSEAKYAKMSVNSALTTLNTAKESKKTTELSKDLAITAAENNWHSAENDLVKAKSHNQQAYDDSLVAAAQADYQIALDNLDKAALKAPTNGEIVKVNYKPGEVIGNAEAESFMEMISGDLLIETDVSESDIAKVKLSNTGVVTFDSLGEEEKFNVQVISIEPAATVIQDVVYYKVKLKLENSTDPRIKPGMTANIDIETNKKTAVLAMPERLVKEDNDTKYVDVLSADNVSKRAEVKLGMRADEGMIEVLSGVKEGDKVIAN